ncbi:uncharacterized protein BCR38DRAFT_407013 [Pseudomassariella vexata]|uniref:Uncharacterized protein n=1 Tax=Pseudomassariella vexata TaxID=1141098 RepID=A0A1Y2E601_9PEZI|nr:uncharacterized protein BCR38DRAFT_407013 [Pseudomassariella vexata]ORY66988.1 hypothetical protein BCR38DRAFT_407013 [Pseudomassariella vexata]
MAIPLPSPQDDQQMVCLVEGLSPETVKMLGSHIGIHPASFVELERVSIPNNRPFRQSDAVLLSGFLSHLAHFTLRCFEPCFVDMRYWNFACAATEPDAIQGPRGSGEGFSLSVRQTNPLAKDAGVVLYDPLIITIRTKKPIGPL